MIRNHHTQLTRMGRLLVMLSAIVLPGLTLFATNTVTKHAVSLENRDHLSTPLYNSDANPSDTTQTALTVTGTIYDAATRETLPAATVQISGTYKGTVSNSEGRYEIVIDTLPAELIVRFLGFQSQSVWITAESDSVLDISLSPSVLALPELVITEDDPALSIMERVIARKQIWSAGLFNFKAQAYTRVSLSNDSSVVMISESVNDVYWDREKGYREILKTYEKTSNLDDTIIPIGVNDLPNFYDDNIEILSYNVVGVTHPDALDYYEFKLLDYESIDDQLIYKIEVSPRRKLQPTFEGIIYVLDREFALLEVNLRPGKVIVFPPPVQEVSFTYSQQYSDYGGDFWLPVDSRVNGSIKVGLPGLQFPTIKVDQLARVSEYEVNTIIPTAVLEEEDIVTIDSLSIANTRIGEAGRVRVPLTQEESQAYEVLDSTMTMDKAFKPTGFLANMIDDSDEEADTSRFFGEGPIGDAVNFISGIYTPSVRLDRVNGPFLGGRVSKSFGKLQEKGRVQLYVEGGYAFHRGEWDRGAGIQASRRFQNNLRLTGQVEMYEKATIRQQFGQIPRSTYDLEFLFGGVDPMDHYLQRGWESNLSIRKGPVSFTTGFQSVTEESVVPEELFTYSLTGSRNQPRRVNPAIQDGISNRMRFGILVSESDGFEGSTAGFAGVNRFSAQIDYSDASFGSDHDYLRFYVDGELSVNTFYKRRFLPNTFSMKASAGLSHGHLPYQHLFTIEPTTLSFAPFGVLKTLPLFPYEGDRYWRVYAEHDFKSIPFEALGLWGFSEKGIGLIVFGGAANAWISDPASEQTFKTLTPVLRESNGVHYETGISVNGIFSIMRLDAAFRLDQPDFRLTVGIARYF